MLGCWFADFPWAHQSSWELDGTWSFINPFIHVWRRSSSALKSVRETSESDDWDALKFGFQQHLLEISLGAEHFNWPRSGMTSTRKSKDIRGQDLNSYAHIILCPQSDFRCSFHVFSPVFQGNSPRIASIPVQRDAREVLYLCKDYAVTHAISQLQCVDDLIHQYKFPSSVDYGRERTLGSLHSGPGSKKLKLLQHTVSS